MTPKLGAHTLGNIRVGLDTLVDMFMLLVRHTGGMRPALVDVGVLCLQLDLGCRSMESTHPRLTLTEHVAKHGSTLLALNKLPTIHLHLLTFGDGPTGRGHRSMARVMLGLGVAYLSAWYLERPVR